MNKYIFRDLNQNFIYY